MEEATPYGQFFGEEHFSKLTFSSNVARTWAYETACILRCEKELDKNLPYNKYFEYFGPEYKLEVKATNMEDLNESDKYLEGIK